MVAMPTTAAVNRASIHASPAAYTFKRVAEILAPELYGAPIINNNNMHLFTLTRFAEMAGISSYRLPGSAAGEYAQKYA